MAVTKKQWERSRAFILSQPTIEALWSVLAKIGKNPTARFECSDGSEITVDEVEALISFPNAQQRRITTIGFENAYGSDTRATVTFWSKRVGDPKVDYRVVGQDQDVLYASRQLEEILANCFPWYSRIWGIPAFVTGLLIGFVCTSGASILASKLLTALAKSPPPPPEWLLWIQSAALLFAAMWGLSKSRLLLFPPAIFAIGNSAQSEARFAYRRQFVGTGLLLAVITGVAAAWLYDRL
jgi:hypothetical protein